MLVGLTHVDDHERVGSLGAGCEPGDELHRGEHRPGRRRGGRRRRRVRVDGGDAGADQGNLREAAGERVDHQDAPDQRGADPGDQLDRLGGHQRAHLAAQRAEHARFGTVGHLTLGGRRREQVAQVHTGHAAVGGRGGPEHRQLRIETQHGCPHQRQAQRRTGVVDEEPGGEVVRAVDDDVVAADDRGGVAGVEPFGVLHDHGLRRDLGDRLGGADHLGPSDIRLAVHDLALQVAGFDVVAVDDADRADPGRGQVDQGRGTQPAGAEHEHPCVGEAALAELVQLRQTALACGAGGFGGAEAGDRLDERRNGHDYHGRRCRRPMNTRRHNHLRGPLEFSALVESPKRATKKQKQHQLEETDAVSRGPTGLVSEDATTN